MTAMQSITRRAVLLIMTAIATGAGLQQAAAERAANNENPRRLSFAGSDASDDPTPDGPSWRNIAGMVAADLKASGRFALAEPAAPIDENFNTVPAFDKWRNMDTEWLVIGRVSRPAPRLKVEFRLWNVITGQHWLGQQYFLAPEQWRDVSHVIAKEILKLER